MADKSKTRMNLAAIKKVDPYAKDIVDSSSHVAFYIFDSEQNEWEKTDVEGAFFIYSRNAQPFHSIFINNRLNTTSFVEPITTHLELQAQAPFLLYRNERSRIRGFWFYNSLECERISKLVNGLVVSSSNTTGSETVSSENGASQPFADSKENSNVNIFKMLSNAQQEFNSSQSQKNLMLSSGANNAQQGKQNQLIASGNVLKFFEAAKPTAEVSYTQRILPNTLSVEQLEKQQRDIHPAIQQSQLEVTEDNTSSQHIYTNTDENVSNRISCALLESGSNSFPTQSLQRPGSTTTMDVKPVLNNRGPDFGFTQALTAASCPSSNLPGEQISLSKIFSSLNMKKSLSQTSEITPKPALMPPTMFDKPSSVASSSAPNCQPHSAAIKSEPLNKFQFIQAFTFMLQNDEDFVEKLHEAYLKSLNKFGTYQ